MRTQQFIKTLKFQFCSKKQNPSTMKTVYKRDLPKELVQFSSEKGKLVFQEALLEGNLESYFPLSEQFNTQSGPPTCGATTLTMIFNALGIDPQKRWKGIWRWWSEEMIEGITQDQLDRGMDLEFFTHIAKHNDASIQTFYINNEQNIIKKGKEQVEYYDCKLNCNIENHRTANGHTFKTFLISSSRRTGMYFVINNSRKILKQTGDGHFMPIGGVNLKRNLALCFDVARFKYPPYWVDIDILYDSLAPFDKSTNKSRGFALLSKCYKKFSSLCRISPDYTSLKLTTDALKQHLVHRAFKPYEIENSYGIYIQNVINSLPYDFQVLIAFYIYETLNFMETQFQQGKKVNKYNLLMEQIEQLEMFKLLENPEIKQYYQNSQLFYLLNDTLENNSTHILTLLLISLPKQIIKFEDKQIESVFQQDVEEIENNKYTSQSDQDLQLVNQIKLLRQQIGFREIEDNLCSFQVKFEKQQQIEVNQEFN